jgi:hypothetical protein
MLRQPEAAGCGLIWPPVRLTQRWFLTEAKENGMTAYRTWRIAAAVLGTLLGPAALAQAQTADEGYCPKTRAEVRAECSAFMKLHRWDEASSNWVLKEGAKTPEGVATRAQIRAERNKFLETNRWNGALSQWEPIAGAPRDLSKLSRAEVRAETRAFMRTHVWDDASSTYVERKTK